MDGCRFDSLARTFAASTSRRSVLKGLMAAAAATLIANRDDAEATCRPLGRLCTQDANCCGPATCAPDGSGRKLCTCPPGLVACDGECVDPATFQSDADNCGACGNRCPGDICQGPICVAGACSLAPDPLQDGNPCDDGNPCTVGDTCQAGTCVGMPQDCSGNDTFCGIGVCDPATGECTVENKPDGSDCPAGSCHPNATCQNGVCEPGEPIICLPGDVCNETAQGCLCHTPHQPGDVFPLCGDPAVSEFCVCMETTEGELWCADFDGGCGDNPACTSSSDCPVNTKCVVGSLCDPPNICAAFCGASPT